MEDNSTPSQTPAPSLVMPGINDASAVRSNEPVGAPTTESSDTAPNPSSQTYGQTAAEENADGPKRPRVRDLFEWRSMDRTAWQYGKEVFTTFGAIALLVSIILAFFQEWLAILVTWAAFFLFWSLTRIAPEEVGHKITTEGIISMNHAYLWSELGPFWFTQSHEGFSDKGHEHALHVAHRNIFGQLILMITPADKEKIRDALAEYLPFIEVPEKSVVEKMSDWFSKKFPITQKPKVAPPSMI